ncbi:MAG: 4Fe-4S dicluster domain-containing protein [Betaproteobacteria bacterium]
MEAAEEKAKQRKVSRRRFLKMAGAVTAGAILAEAVPRVLWLDDALAAIPVSGGYLLLDRKKCAGCCSCMLACSLAHEGRESLSLARIQIAQNSFGRFPDDLTPSQCRQCVDPACVNACPTGALHADPKNEHVRLVDADKCIGCQSCVKACPFTPSRAVWNFEDGHAQKCDLCANTPYWNGKGGPKGLQACVEICPMKAIKFTKEIPVQVGDAGYSPNLRKDNWKRLGFPTD